MAEPVQYEYQSFLSVVTDNKYAYFYRSPQHGSMMPGTGCSLCRNISDPETCRRSLYRNELILDTPGLLPSQTMVLADAA